MNIPKEEHLSKADKNNIPSSRLFQETKKNSGSFRSLKMLNNIILKTKMQNKEKTVHQRENKKFETLTLFGEITEL